MRIEIVGKKYEVEKDTEELIRGKIERHLSKYFKDDQTCRVVCKEEHGKYKMELTIMLGDAVLRAENSDTNMDNNIFVIVPKIERQMRKLRTKYAKKLRDDVDVSEIPQEEDAKEEVIRTKRYNLYPMSVDDAIFQLEMVDHDFYIFINRDSGETCVVYKRKDGGIGLIEAVTR